MTLSIAGLLICFGIFLVARAISSAPLVVAVFMSSAFGSTAIVILSALGGSSPVIYVVFAVAMIASVAMRRDVMRELGTVFSQQPAAWLLAALAVYAVVGSYLLPRLFEGEVTAFIPQRTEGSGIVEVPLAPVSGNATQTLYFLIGIVSFFALSVLLRQRRTFLAIRNGYFAWATLHVCLGVIDLVGKMAGLGDILAPIRTASYAMATNVSVEGFWRIAGAYSEASAFGSVSLMLLVFTFCYWKFTRDTYALVLWVALLVLTVLSTSSTAYLAGTLLLLALLASITSSVLRDRLRKQDLLLLVIGLAGVGMIAGIVLLYNDRALDPFLKLFDSMLLNKGSSVSAEERSYWNYRSVMALYETGGLGIGIGSSRASSWIVAVVSQLGIIGSLMFAALLLEFTRSDRSRLPPESDSDMRAIALSVRSACLAGLLTASIAGSGADPGLNFFLGVAVVLSYRWHAKQGIDNDKEALLASYGRQLGADRADRREAWTRGHRLGG